MPLPPTGPTGTPYAWIEAGLQKLGLTLDLDVRALPSPLRGGTPLSIDGLMSASLALAAAPPPWEGRVLSADDAGRGWRVEVGKIPGNPYFISRTVVPQPRQLDLAGFVSFAVDNSMMDLARAWDMTYRSAAFSHVILRTGEVFGVGERPLDGIPWTDIAKIMRWEFAVPGLARRELLSVYVCHVDSNSATCCYFPVTGAAFPVTPGRVRARLAVPCLDRVTFEGPRMTSLLHYACAQLEGFMPSFLTTSSFYGRAFWKAAKEEAAFLTELADGTGKVGAALRATTRQDGTQL